MDLKQIEKLMEAMERSRIKRLSLKKEGFEIEMERECQGSSIEHPINPPQYPPQLPAYFQPPPIHPSMEAKNKIPHVEQTAPAEVQTGFFVTSPMVGTFYGAPSPDDPPFIKVGDAVNEGTVVCIIEAMKVMNEVKAGVNGKVAEILLRSGDPVEFGTRIFRIDPS